MHVLRFCKTPSLLVRTFGLVLLCAVIIAPAKNGMADVSWLQQVSNCDELAAKIRDSFARPAPASPMSEQQKTELPIVLNVVCGPRFAQCNFSVCQKWKVALPPPPPTQTQDSSQSAVQQSAVQQSAVPHPTVPQVSPQERLAKIVAEDARRRKDMILAERRSEREQGLRWQKFQMTQEADAMRERRQRRLPPPSETPGYPSDPYSASEAGYPTQGRRDIQNFPRTPSNEPTAANRNPRNPGSAARGAISPRGSRGQPGALARGVVLDSSKLSIQQQLENRGSSPTEWEPPPGMYR